MQLDGIHHISAITGDAARNVDFYTRVLGLRMIAKTVNQDDPSVYHLFYGDEHARPGADLTFFEYPGARPGRPGAGMVHRIVWRVGSPRGDRVLGGAAGGRGRRGVARAPPPPRPARPGRRRPLDRCASTTPRACRTSSSSRRRRTPR